MSRQGALVGYKRRDPVGHRRYSWTKSIARFKKTGYFRTVQNGSGHTAGFNWGAAKGIDPNSQERRYSKNSPSFDEGVYAYKQREKALQTKSE